ncbi:MAG: aminodeoxychorismate synthase component I [Rhizobiales bacterium]|nr:aminodeoxychorismate synthase component I [Hyphomicrobiales bacterium]
MTAAQTAKSDAITIREIGWQKPHEIFQAFAADPFALFLDGATPQPGEYQSWSFIALDPVRRLVGRVDQDDDIFGELAAELEARKLETARDDLPPFIGGAAGYFGYGLGRVLEKLPAEKAPFAVDDQQLPDIALGFYDLVIAFDHLKTRAFICASGQAPDARIEKLKTRLAHAPAFRQPAAPVKPQPIQAGFSRQDYEAAVARVIDYIKAGDIFQANLSQRFESHMAEGDTPYALYLRLREASPAPFACFFNFGEGVLISSSPERFLLSRDRLVETRPIKGTRPRGATPAEDRALADELLASEKDRAENIMIVDLLRNDISRVCADHTVHASQLCTLESYANVHHLVSAVHGRLRPGASNLDLLAACFPGGSITGAPKLRAMEIIAELEPTTRGPYCGAIGYLGDNGHMDTAITIRTMVVKEGRVTFQAGGGIVADSDPASEYVETLDKARAMRVALRGQSDSAIPHALDETGT